MSVFKTAPICDSCWRAIAGNRTPIRLRAKRRETCYRCGRRTMSGIYTRTEVSGG